MKKSIVAIVFALSIALASTLMVNKASGDIEARTWLGSTYSWGNDPYYGASVYGYRQNSVATVWVRVHNDLSGITRMNVTSIMVAFDWGINYTNTLPKTLVMEDDEVRFFTVTFTVPNTTIASNTYLHGYTIYAKHVNGTGSSLQPMTTGTTYTRAPDFAVYSDDQMDAWEKARIVNQLREPDSDGPDGFGGFNSTAARIAWSKALNETSLANTLYALGNFADADVHYAKALDLKNQAFTLEQALSGGIQDAELALFTAQAKSFDAQANFFNGMSYMWVLIGVALVLFAIGYIIRGFGAFRKTAIST